MKLIRVSPFHEINRLRRDMNSLLDEAFYPNNKDTQPWVDTINAELSQNNEVFYLKLEMPGLEAKDLDISVTINQVVINGERTFENPVENSEVIYSEFHYGKFQRVISLPARIQNNNVKADFKNGILTLTLPKAEEEKNKVVKVNIN